MSELRRYLAEIGARGGRELRERPPGEIGCLYYSTPEARFVVPRADMRLADQGVQVRFGAPGGVLPQLTNASIEAPD